VNEASVGALVALAWGLAAGAALPLGAAAGIFLRLPPRVTAVILAFGSGTLIAAFSVVMMETAWEQGGIGWTAAGFLAGAFAYTAADWWLDQRSRGAGEEHAGMAIAAGSFLDNVPESVVLGAATLSGGAAPMLLAGIFLSNFPEAMASARRLKKARWSAARVLLLWGGIGLAAALSAWAGAVLLTGAPDAAHAIANATAAGAVVAMLADALIPQAYKEGHDLAGIATAAGFLLAFVLHKASA
jgi:ZIP family zinc transporter